MTVVGIVAGDGPIIGSAGRTVILPLRTMQRIFDDQTVSRVDVVAGEGASPGEVGAAIAVALTSGPYVLSSPGDVGASLRSSTADFRSTTALIAAVALFVGAFLIFNTLSMTVSERVRELGLLRAAGATRRQLVGFVGLQAVVLGLLGALLGLVAGFVLAELMAIDLRTIAAIPFERVDPGLGPSAAVVAIGLGVTIAAAIEPARRAGSIPPVEALRDRIDPIAARRARLRWLVGVFVVVGVAGLLAWPRDAGTAGLARSGLVYLVLLAAVLIAPLVLGGLGRVAGLPFRTVLRLEERLARASIVRDRSRTTLTVGALAIGLAMVVAIGGVAHQSRLAASEWLSEVVPGDELVTSIRPIALDEEVITDLAAVDGVERVSPFAIFEVARAGVRMDAAAVAGADLLADGRLRFVVGDRTAALMDLDEGGVAILPRSIADRTGLTVGSTLTLAVGEGRVVDLRVAGVAERTLPGKVGEAALVGWPDATAVFGVEGADVLAVRYVAGRAAEAAPRLEAAARLAALEPSPLATIAGAVDSALGQVFGLFDALAIVAVIVAAVCLLALSLLLGRTEIGLHMRAASMDFSTARMLGVRANRVIGTAVLISGALAAVVAVILTVSSPLVTPDFALRDTIIVLAGVVLGGLNRPLSATLGGFSIGFASGLLGGALPTDQSQYLPTFLFAAVIVVLLVRPNGLFDRSRAVERV